MRAQAAARGQVESKYGEKVATPTHAASNRRNEELRPAEAEVRLSDADDLLTRQLQSLQPRRLIAVGEDAPRLLRGYADTAPRCELEAIRNEDAVERLQSLKSERRYDFALVAGYLERVDSAQGSAVIARLRDVLARRLCVLVATEKSTGSDTIWSDAELSAFGFTLLSRFEENGKQASLYGFDIASYKQTPDWLNPRHWAHPELWGKFRW